MGPLIACKARTSAPLFVFSRAFQLQYPAPEASCMTPRLWKSFWHLLFIPCFCLKNGLGHRGILTEILRCHVLAVGLHLRGGRTDVFKARLLRFAASDAVG